MESAPHWKHVLPVPAGTDRQAAAWQLSWQRWQRSLPYGCVLQFAGTLLILMFTLRVVGRVHQLTLLWPVGGTAAGLALPYWQRGPRTRLLMVFSAFGGAVAGAALCGVAPWLASVLSFTVVCDLVLTCTLLSPRVRTFADLQVRGNILRLLLSVLLVPITCGLVAGFPVAHTLHLPVLRVIGTVMLSDAIGQAVMVPLCLFLFMGLPGVRSWVSASGLRGALTVLLMAATAGLVFWQGSRPVLFMVFPPLILLLLELGLQGAVISSVLLTTIGWFATNHGHGPMWLIQGGDALDRLLLLQLFCLVCLLTSLPVGALLDERRRSESKLKTALAVQGVLLQHTDQIIVLSSSDGSQRYVSPAVTRLAGWLPEEYLAQERLSTMHPSDLQTLQPVVEQLLRGDLQNQSIRYRMRHKNGGYIWVEAALRSYGLREDGQYEGYVATIRSVDDEVEREQSWQQERAQLSAEGSRLATLASTDPLTGLLNRRGLDAALASPQRRSTGGLAVLSVDVDFFKQFNDAYGHAAGDDCLVQVGRLLRNRCARFGDLAARVGGEEFVLLLPGADALGALAVAADLQNELQARDLQHARSPFGRVTISIGVTSREGFVDEATAHEMIASSDAALYASKHQGRNRATLWEPEMSLAGLA